MLSTFSLSHLLTFALPSVLAGPLTPSEAIKAFQLADDRLVIDLVACEPQIEDPVAMAFDAAGRMYVVEMRGFQQGPDAKGLPGLGRVTMLEDRDHDGRYEYNTVFADHMYYATTVTAAYGGIVVGCAPDILFFKDTDGDGRADIRKVVYTGFGRGNHEQLLNSFQWAIDNWIHAASGGSGGQIRPANQPDAEPVNIGTRNFRFRITPDGDPAGFETVSGGAQWGLATDDADHWFTAQNPRHIIQIVLPEHYTRRNPLLAVPKTLVDIPDHGAACKVFRVSPLEEWRVVRTRQRAATMANKYPPNELVPGGFITSGCGIHIYRADLLPEGYDGQSFTCEPANNLIHRDRLAGPGPQLTAVRIDDNRDFLASTDGWFRPVTTLTGPDGGLYVVDMYREIIETPASIPPEILKTINMDNGNNMGRIYRIRPADTPPRPVPDLAAAPTQQLVDRLGEANSWIRLTAQRLLYERRDPAALPALTKLASQEKPLSRLHALCTLADMNGLTSDLLAGALRDPDARVRAAALRLSEPFLSGDAAQAETLLGVVTGLKDDPSADVRFQLALTLSMAGPGRSTDCLLALARRDLEDPWIRTAILLALGDRPAGFWNQLRTRTALFERPTPPATEFTRDLASVVGAGQQAPDWVALLEPLSQMSRNQNWAVQAVLDGLRVGLDRAGGHAKLSGPPDAARVPGLLLNLLDQAAVIRSAAWALGARMTWPPSAEYDQALQKALDAATDSEGPLPERSAALQFAAVGPPDRVAPRLLKLLDPEQPVEIQKSVVAALGASDRVEIAAQLLDRDRWFAYTPAVRDAVISAVLARNAFVPPLLKAIQDGYVPAWIIDAPQRERLLASRDPAIRDAAARVLAPASAGERQKVFEAYLPALNQSPDPARGREVFRTHCAACHLLEGFGSAVGPDLAGVRDRPADQLLGDILLPSRTVTAGYSAYMIETRDGDSLTGVIANESATAITLRQKDGVETTLLRSQIQTVYASSLSMMPEDLEQTITPRQMADLIAYLKASR